MSAVRLSLWLSLAASAMALCSAAGQSPRASSIQLEAKERSYIGQPDAIRAGEKLYRRHCSECHGADGRGIGKARNLRSAAVQSRQPADLVEFLRQGSLRRGMPSWAVLPAERRWQIVAYLKTLGNRSTPPGLGASAAPR